MLNVEWMYLYLLPIVNHNSIWSYTFLHSKFNIQNLKLFLKYVQKIHA